MKLNNALLLSLSGALVSAGPLQPRDCNHNNCLRQLIDSPQATTFCATYTTTVNTAKTGLPTYVSQCDRSPSKISSACSCIATTSTSSPAPTTTTTTGTSSTTGSTDTSLPDISTTVTMNTEATALPAQTALPMIIGPWDGTNGTTNSIKSGPSKKVLSGADNADGSYLLTIIQYTAKQGRTLINLEDFVPFVSSVACGTSSIGVTFKDAAGFAAASTNWLSPTASPIGLITSNGAFCGTNETTRTHYKINSILPATTPLTLTLSVTPVGMEEIASGVKVDFGTLRPGQVAESAPLLGTELGGSWGAIQNHFNAQGVQKREDRSTTWDINTDDFLDFFGGLVGGMFDVPAPPSGPQTTILGCPECGLFGKFTLHGGYELAGAPNMYLSMEMEDLHYDLMFVVDIQDPTTIGMEWLLAAFKPSPINVPDVLYVGPTVELRAGFKANIDGFLAVRDLGYKGSMPKSTWRFDTSKGVTKSGWDMQSSGFKPIIAVRANHMGVGGWMGPALAFEVEILPGVSKVAALFGVGPFKWSADVKLEFPQLNVDFDKLPPAQSCNPAEGQNSYSVKTSFGIDIIAEYSGYLTPSYSTTIFSKHPLVPLFETCTNFFYNY